MGSQWPLRGLSSFSFSCCLSLEYHGSHNHWVVCIFCPSSVNKSKDLTHCRLSMKMGGDKDDEGPWKSNSWYQIFSQCSSKLHHLCPILYWDCLPREEWVPLAISEQNVSVIITPPVSMQRNTHRKPPSSVLVWSPAAPSYSETLLCL